MKSTPEIRSVKARAIVVPLKRPLKNAFGVFEAAPLVLIDVATDQGVTGHAYIFAYATMTQKPQVHLIEQIGRDLTGRAIAPFNLMATLDAKFRLLGFTGTVYIVGCSTPMFRRPRTPTISRRPWRADTRRPGLFLRGIMREEKFQARGEGLASFQLQGSFSVDD
jgi:hypothetical protein